MNKLMIIGIFHDIVGVVILARALAFVNNEEISNNAGTYFGGNNALTQSQIEQRYDAKYGLLIVVIGFLWQIVSLLKMDISWVLAVTSILILVSLYLIRRARVVKSDLSQIKREEKSRSEEEVRERKIEEKKKATSD